MNFRKNLGVALLGVSGLMASMVMTASPSMAASCWTSHTASQATGRCSGYMNTGTFWVAATFCSQADGCHTVNGSKAALQGGTSVAKAPRGSFHWSSDRIVYGPPAG